MKYLCQLLIYDRGTPDLEVYFSVARDPLKHVSTQPSRVIEWTHEETRYFVAYWHKSQRGMTDEEIRTFAQSGYYLR